MRSFLVIVIFTMGFMLTASAQEKEVVVSEAEMCCPVSSPCEPSRHCHLEFKNYELARHVRNILFSKKWLVASAESMTSGNFSGTLGRVHWAGGGVAGGVVSYNVSVKNALLGVTASNEQQSLSDQAAKEMVNGLSQLFRDVNKFQVSRAQEAKVNVFVSFTGTATTWQGNKPHVRIAIKIGDQEPVVKLFNLDQNLKDSNLERMINIQLAVQEGLKFLLSELKKDEKS